jgi:hypothetical protein
MKLTPETIQKYRNTLLEFFARFVMNTVKLILGLALGVAIVPTKTISAAMVASTQNILLMLVVLAFFISLIETWQDWEFVPKKSGGDEPASA